MPAFGASFDDALYRNPTLPSGRYCGLVLSPGPLDSTFVTPDSTSTSITCEVVANRTPGKPSMRAPNVSRVGSWYATIFLPSSDHFGEPTDSAGVVDVRRRKPVPSARIT